VVFGKWVADPEPDNPQSGLRVPRTRERERERERERSSENARSFSWVFFWLLGLTCEWYLCLREKERERRRRMEKSGDFFSFL